MSAPFAAVTITAWALLLIGLANHAAAGDWWEIGVLFAAGAGLIVAVAVRGRIRSTKY